MSPNPYRNHVLDFFIAWPLLTLLLIVVVIAFKGNLQNIILTCFTSLILCLLAVVVLYWWRLYVLKEYPRSNIRITINHSWKEKGNLTPINRLFLHPDIYKRIQNKCRLKSSGIQPMGSIFYVYLPAGQLESDFGSSADNAFMHDRVAEAILRKGFENEASRFARNYLSNRYLMVGDLENKLKTTMRSDMFKYLNRENFMSILVGHFDNNMENFHAYNRKSASPFPDSDFQKARESAINQQAENLVDDATFITSGHFPNIEDERMVFNHSFKSREFVCEVIDEALKSMGLTESNPEMLEEIVLNKITGKIPTVGHPIQAVFNSIKSQISDLFKYQPFCKHNYLNWLWPRVIVVVEGQFIRGETLIKGYLYSKGEIVFNTHRSDITNGDKIGVLTGPSRFLPYKNKDKELVWGNKSHEFADFVDKNGAGGKPRLITIKELAAMGDKVEDYPYTRPIAIGNVDMMTKTGQIELVRIGDAQIEVSEASSDNLLPRFYNIFGFGAGSTHEALNRVESLPVEEEERKGRGLFSEFTGFDQEMEYQDIDLRPLRIAISGTGSACITFDYERRRWVIFNLDSEGRTIYIKNNMTSTRSYIVKNIWSVLPSRCFLFIGENGCKEKDMVVFDVNIGTAGTPPSQESHYAIVDPTPLQIEVIEKWLNSQHFEEFQRYRIKIPIIYRAYSNKRWYFVKHLADEAFEREKRIFNRLNTEGLLRPRNVSINDSMIVSPEMQLYEKTPNLIPESERYDFLIKVLEYILELNSKGIYWLDVTIDHVMRDPYTDKVCFIDFSGFLLENDFRSVKIRDMMDEMKRAEVIIPEIYLEDFEVDPDKVQTYVIAQFIVACCSKDGDWLNHNDLENFLYDKNRDQFDEALKKDLDQLSAPDWIRPALLTDPKERYSVEELLNELRKKRNPAGNGSGD